MSLCFRDDYLVEISKNKSVLHIGAANYPEYKELLKEGKLIHLKISKVAKEVIGIDISLEAVNYLRDHGIKNIFWGDIVAGEYEINLNQKTFEVILFPEVIEHISNPGMALENIKKLMSKESTLIITTPNAYHIKDIVKYILTGVDSPYPDHVMLFSTRTISRLLERHGFYIEEITFCLYSDRENFNNKNLWGKFVENVIYWRKPFRPNLIIKAKRWNNI